MKQTFFQVLFLFSFIWFKLRSQWWYEIYQLILEINELNILQFCKVDISENSEWFSVPLRPVMWQCQEVKGKHLAGLLSKLIIFIFLLLSGLLLLGEVHPSGTSCRLKYTKFQNTIQHESGWVMSHKDKTTVRLQALSWIHCSLCDFLPPPFIDPCC